MRIIHTSDWHLGKKLYGRTRYKESEKFLDWLLKTIEEENADALIVTGDVFDSVSPSNRALEQYYGFLYRASTSCCRDVIITAGNHDSPSLLNAPKELLERLNVHVIGNASEDPEDEVITIYDKEKNPGAVVCAVPYLREKDLRKTTEYERPGEKSQKVLSGIKEHYSGVFARAEAVRDSYSEKRLPIIATGHLFVAGGITLSGDGVREIYVGNLERAGLDIFPSEIDYLALGHLHVPQKVGGSESRRYSGSPLPVGFSEAGQKKMVILADFSPEKPSVKEIYIPAFRRLETIEGSLDEISQRISELNFSDNNIWAEIIYTGSRIHGDLSEEILKITKDSSVEVLRIKNESLSAGILRNAGAAESLSDLSEYEVFERCLDSAGICGGQREELKETFRDTVICLYEEDSLSGEGEI